MRILNVSAECYPAAKVGGLADVVGALPKYLNRMDVGCDVVMPKYYNKWILSQEVELVFESAFHLGSEKIYYQIQKNKNKDLGYDQYFVDIPGKFDRGGVYADPASGDYYRDELFRNISFQRAVLDYLVTIPKKYDIVHCHDHHTGLIPFLMAHGLAYTSISQIPTVFTIHNGAYQGMFGWNMQYLLPAFRIEQSGMLDWGQAINSLAAGVKSSWQWTSVSETYIDELTQNGFGLTWLFNDMRWKASGIVNGIDADDWDPATDPLLQIQLKRSIKTFKQKNKTWLCGQLGLDPALPLHIFIGRMVMDKGVDFLNNLFYHYLNGRKDISVIILGSGDHYLEEQTRGLENMFTNNFKAMIMYNEKFAHQLYAGSDFIWMPSRFEPCGLNQMYAMRYGTVPIVRATGGLKDTVAPFRGKEGNGFLILDLELDQGFAALYASNDLYQNEKIYADLRKRNMAVDSSWEKSAQKYIDIYTKLKK